MRREGATESAFAASDIESHPRRTSEGAGHHDGIEHIAPPKIAAVAHVGNPRSGRSLPTIVHRDNCRMVSLNRF
jgi:hypothetical protein